MKFAGAKDKVRLISWNIKGRFDTMVQVCIPGDPALQVEPRPLIGCRAGSEHVRREVRTSNDTHIIQVLGVGGLMVLLI